jgi:anti-sigma factor RsiW
MIAHRELRELAAGAALDDLDPVERGLLDDHIGSCDACATLSLELEDIVADLALSAPEIRPPVALRQSVMRAIRPVATTTLRALPSPSDPIPVPGQDGTEATVDLETLRRERRTGRRLTVGALGIAAVLAIATLGSGLNAIGLQDELARRQVQLDDATSRAGRQAAAMTVALHPSHLTASLEAEPIAGQAHAQVVYLPGTTDAYLIVDALPPTPAGFVYQLWVADHEGVHGLATFHHVGGTFVAGFGLDLTGKEAAMVTLEPSGGAVGEPGPQVVFGEL